MEPLKLSDQLINDLKEVMIGHDSRAEEDGVAIQYYAAIIGLVLAQQEYSLSQKKEFLDHLYAFTKHVFEDNVTSSQPVDAVGKWHPGDP